MASRLFVVSARISEDYMDLLDCAVFVEGTARGRFLQDALADWASGVGPGFSRAVQCWKAWKETKVKKRGAHLRTFCAEWSRDHPDVEHPKA
jgi:hypothetical protein